MQFVHMLVHVCLLESWNRDMDADCPWAQRLDVTLGIMRSEGKDAPQIYTCGCMQAQ